MSELQHYYDMCRQGAFVRESEEECGCRGTGWFLSEVDTWHSCRAHNKGQPHPEDESEHGPHDTFVNEEQPDVAPPEYRDPDMYAVESEAPDDDCIPF